MTAFPDFDYVITTLPVNTYIDRIHKLAERKDLTINFSDDTLRTWARDTLIEASSLKKYASVKVMKLDNFDTLTDLSDQLISLIRYNFIIYATSGAGKSTLSRDFPAHFIDADTRVVWPHSEAKHYATNPRTDVEQYEILRSHIPLLRRMETYNRAVLYNPARVQLEMPQPMFTPENTALLLVSRPWLERNLAHRNARVLAGKTTRSFTKLDKAWHHQTLLENSFKTAQRLRFAQDADVDQSIRTIEDIMCEFKPVTCELK
jgi:hypothetical protein